MKYVLEQWKLICAAMFTIVSISACSLDLYVVDLNDPGISRDVFITLWDTRNIDANSSASNQVRLPLVAGVSYDCAIDWGDASPPERITSGPVLHTYKTAGIYQIRMLGRIPRIAFESDHLKLIDVQQWGSNRWSSMSRMFAGCIALRQISAADRPDLSVVSDVSFMFYDARLFKGKIGDWDVSSVTNMAGMFSTAVLFNDDISRWDVSNVTDMSEMFADASSFNQNLSKWNVGKVIDGTHFDKDSVTWVKPKPLNLGTERDNSHNIVLAKNASIEPFITVWKIAADDKTLTLPLLVGESYDFDIDWGDGQIQTITSPAAAHTYASAGIYKVSIKANTPGKFPRMAFDGVGDRLKLLDVLQWGTNRWSSMLRMFRGCERMQVSALDRPDLSAVTNMASMFESAHSFSGNIGHWDTSNVENMSALFGFAYSFNGSIKSWNVSKVTEMSTMFYGAFNFNQDLNDWDVSNVTDMSGMFTAAISFNGVIKDWNVGKVTSMNEMFVSAYLFNGEIGNWKPSMVNNMSYMFDTAYSFNQDLSRWDTSSISSRPSGFDNNAYRWILPRPVWPE